MVSPHGRILSSFSYHKVRLFCEDLAETKVQLQPIDFGRVFHKNISIWIGDSEASYRMRYKEKRAGRLNKMILSFL